MDAAKTIELMGGKHVVSGFTGASPNAVTQWRRIGIPARYWHIFVAEAESRHVEGITFETLSASKPGVDHASAA